MRALSLVFRSTSGEPQALPEPLTADIRALLRGHLLKGGVMGESDDPLVGDRFMSAFDRRVDPEVREVRRLEVINGALGRRRWDAEAKARIVAESLAPGVAVSEVARRHELRPQQLFAWRQQAKQGRFALPAEDLAFVPVVAAAETPPASAKPAGFIEIALGGVVVRVPPEVDGRLLAKVLRAVKAAV